MRAWVYGAAMGLIAASVFGQTFTPTLAGSRETGGGGDPAGAGLAVIAVDGTTVSYYIQTRGIARPTAARIHTGRGGESGPAVIDLTPSFTSPTSGLFVAAGSVASDAATAAAIAKTPSAYYVDVDNAAFPDGAVRGQLLGDGPASAALAATLWPFREPGGGDAGASGFAAVAVDGTTVSYYLALKGGTPTAARVQSGIGGQSGPVVIDLTPAFNAGVAFGSVSADAGLLAQIVAHPEMYYLNVLSAGSPTGAARGQLGPTETDIYFPVVAHNAGQGTSFFKTDVRIVSLTDEPATVYAEWYPKGGTGAAGPAAVAQVPIGAGGEAVLDDVEATLFGGSDRAAIRFLSTYPVKAIARNFNDQRASGSGTFGQDEPGLGADGALTSGVLMYNSNRPKADHLDFRTNIGYFNPNPAPAVVTFNVHRPDGTLIGLPATLTIPAWTNDQFSWFQTIPNVPADQQTQANFFVTFTSTQPVFLFSSVVDNITDDGIHEPAVAAPAALTLGSASTPTAAITAPSGAATAVAGQALNFAGSGSDPSGLALTGHWDFGDSVSAEGLSVAHTYASAGAYVVKFTVTNSRGLASAPDQRSVTVTAASTATLSMIQSQIFTPICSSCHPPNQGQDLRAGNAWASIVNQPSHEQPALARVKPGDPDHSYLYLKIVGDPSISGARMPFGGPFLTADQIKLIHDWILAGALDN